MARITPRPKKKRGNAAEAKKKKIGPPKRKGLKAKVIPQKKRVITPLVLNRLKAKKKGLPMKKKDTLVDKHKKRVWKFEAKTKELIKKFRLTRDLRPKPLPRRGKFMTTKKKRLQKKYKLRDEKRAREKKKRNEEAKKRQLTWLFHLGKLNSKKEMIKKRGENRAKRVEKLKQRFEKAGKTWDPNRRAYRKKKEKERLEKKLKCRMVDKKLKKKEDRDKPLSKHRAIFIARMHRLRKLRGGTTRPKKMRIRYMKMKLKEQYIIRRQKILNKMKADVRELAIKSKIRRQKSKKTGRLYAKAIFTGYKRGLRNTYCNTALLKVEGVVRRKDAEAYVGKRCAYFYQTLQGSKSIKGIKSPLKCVWGRVFRTHGNTGCVRAKFARNLPAIAMGKRVRIMLYPSKI